MVMFKWRKRNENCKWRKSRRSISNWDAIYVQIPLQFSTISCVSPRTYFHFPHFTHFFGHNYEIQSSNNVVLCLVLYLQKFFIPKYFYDWRKRSGKIFLILQNDFKHYYESGTPRDDEATAKSLVYRFK